VVEVEGLLWGGFAFWFCVLYPVFWLGGGLWDGDYYVMRAEGQKEIVFIQMWYCM